MRRDLVERARGGDLDAFAGLAADSIGRLFSIGSMGQSRMDQTATLPDDRRVLIASGRNIASVGGVGLTSAVLYQPSIGETIQWGWRKRR